MTLAIGIALIVVGLLVGAFYKGESVGEAACKERQQAADAQIAAKANELQAEATNHIADMATAAEVADKEGYDRAKAELAKGVRHVASNPIVFKNASCVLPPDALRTINAARAGLRRDPSAADGVRAGDSAGTGTRLAADPISADGAVRGAGAAPQGDPRGNVPADAGGRRPLGKVR